MTEDTSSSKLDVFRRFLGRLKEEPARMGAGATNFIEHASWVPSSRVPPVPPPMIRPAVTVWATTPAVTAWAKSIVGDENTFVSRDTIAHLLIQVAVSLLYERFDVDLFDGDAASVFPCIWAIFRDLECAVMPLRAEKMAVALVRKRMSDAEKRALANQKHRAKEQALISQLGGAAKFAEKMHHDKAVKAEKERADLIAPPTSAADARRKEDKMTRFSAWWSSSASDCYREPMVDTCPAGVFRTTAFFSTPAVYDHVVRHGSPDTMWKSLLGVAARAAAGSPEFSVSLMLGGERSGERVPMPHVFGRDGPHPLSNYKRLDTGVWVPIRGAFERNGTRYVISAATSQASRTLPPEYSGCEIPVFRTVMCVVWTMPSDAIIECFRVDSMVAGRMQGLKVEYRAGASAPPEAALYDVIFQDPVLVRAAAAKETFAAEKVRLAAKARVEGMAKKFTPPPPSSERTRVLTLYRKGLISVEELELMLKGLNPK
jgi:hypothetical protein